MVLKMEISYHLCKDGTWFWRWRSHTTFARMVRGFEDRDLIPPLQGWYVVLKMENSYHLCKDGTWCWRWRSHTTNAIRYFCCDNCSFVLFCFVLFCFVLFCFVLFYCIFGILPGFIHVGYRRTIVNSIQIDRSYCIYFLEHLIRVR